MEQNGRNSCTGNSRHISIRYFFIKDRVKCGDVTVKYCPTEYMLADYYTKALQGSLYNIFRNVIMGYDDISIILDFLKSKVEERVGKYPNNETISTVKIQIMSKIFHTVKVIISISKYVKI